MAHPVTHFEVHGKDGKKLQDFYSSAFGWKIDASNPMNYGVVEADGGKGIGGGVTASQDGGQMVTFYVEVSDLKAHLDQIRGQDHLAVRLLHEPRTFVPGRRSVRKL